MLHSDEVDALIKLGQSELSDVPDRFQNDRDMWQRFMCGDAEWTTLAQSLSEPKLAALTKGLVLLGSGPLVAGGSASPAIALYREYRKRFPHAEPELTAWIVDHRTNPYEPFGTPLLNEARSYAEFADANARRDAAREQRIAEQQQAAAITRLIAGSAIPTRRLLDAVRRGDLRAVEALLAKGADVWGAEQIAGMRLSDLAAKEGRTEVVELLLQRDQLISSRWLEEQERFAATVLVVGGEKTEFAVCTPLGATARNLEGLGLGSRFAVITPCNPMGESLDESANATRLRAFRTELALACIPNVEADGWSPDRSHVERGNACALELDAALALAHKWGQLALFWFDGSQFSIVPCFPDDAQEKHDAS